MFPLYLGHGITTAVHLDNKGLLDNYNKFLENPLSFDSLLGILLIVASVVTLLEFMTVFTNTADMCSYKLRDGLLVTRSILLNSSLIVCIVYMVLEKFEEFYSDNIFSSWLIISWMIIAFLGNFWALGSCFFCISGEKEVSRRTLFGHS